MIKSGNHILNLNTEDIHEYQKNRDPFLMIDVAEEVVPGISARGYKDLQPNEWFFRVHWPGDPNMPGVLQIEAMVQLCSLSILTLPGNKGKILYLASANNIKFSRKVVPGDRLHLDTKLLRWKRGIGRCSGTGTVSGEIACQAQFNLVLPDVATKFKVKTQKDKN